MNNLFSDIPEFDKNTNIQTNGYINNTNYDELNFNINNTDPSWNKIKIYASSFSDDISNNKYATISNIMFQDPHIIPYLPGEDSRLRLGKSGGKQNNTWWDIASEKHGNFHILNENRVDKGIIIDPSGNIGIGTSKPQTKLQVIGDVSANSFIGSGARLTNLEFNNINGIVPVMQGGTGATSLDSSYFDTSNNKLSLKLNSITPWNVDQDNVYYNVGNIGIGTSKPQAKLQVSGDISANNFIGSGARLTNLEFNNINGIVPVMQGGTGATSLDSSYFDTSNNKLTLKLNAVTPWNVDQDNVYYNVGNIGIGTDKPQTKLQVVGDVSANSFIGSGARLTNLNPNNINGVVPVMRGGTGATSLDSRYFDTSNNKLSLKLNSITPWNVNKDNVYYNVGNIGIGTSKPQTKLQVIGDVSANNFIGSGARLTNLNPNNINGVVPVMRGGTGATSLDSSYFDTSNNKLSLKLNSITPWNIDQDNVYYNVGNIGIGTDKPQTKLQVAGDISANNFIGSGARLTNLEFNNINGIVPVIQGGTGVTSLDSTYFDTSNNKLSLKLNSITPWNIDQDNVYYNVGNIGIGTDKPQAKLQVIGDVSANNFIGSGARLTNLEFNNINGIVPVMQGGTGVTSLDSTYFDTSNNKLSLKLNSITPWNIDQDNVYYNVGNIGIGTDKPQAKLQVIGDVSANNFIGSGARLTNLEFNNINGIVPAMQGGTGTTSLDSTYFDTSNNKLSLKINSITPWNVNQDNVYYNVGNIGIGTDKPQAKLQVVGDVSANNFIGSGARLTNLEFNNINGIVPVIQGGTGTTSLDSTYFDTSNDKLSLKLNSITPWNIDQDNVYYNVGNIGIGTDKPQAKLQVIGDVSANNFIGSGARLTNLNPNNINGIVPVMRGGTGTTSLDSTYFDTSNNKLSLKLNSITPWNVNQNNVYYNVGNIGIGTDNPRTKLQVTGDVSANNFIGSGARLTNLNPNNINGIVPVTKGGTGTTSLDSTYFDTSNNKLSLKLNSITPWNVNQNNVYYNVGNIGIGTDNPRTKLQVTGDVSANNFIGSGARLTNLNPNNINGIVPVTKGGTGTTSLDSTYFDTSNNKLSLKLNSITPWNVNQNNVYYNVGNIGIGTDNPRTKLQVTGDVSANNFIGSGARLTNLNPNNINGIVPVTKGGTGTTSLDSSYFDTSNNKLSLKLNSITPWNVNQDNVYYNVGNIGIGTDKPQAKLQVTGDVSANNFIGSGARLTNLNPNNINGIVPVTKGGTGTTSLDSTYFDTSNNKLSLKLNSITPWNVNQNNVYYNVGNIGIGTDNPRTKLQVTGDVSANNFIGSGARLTNLNPNNINGIVPVMQGGTGATSLDSSYFDTSNNKLSLKLNSITPWNVNQNNVYYNVGNIGIGTDKPQAKLQVVGDVSANNFIGSGARLTNLNPNNINGIVPVTKGGTGTTSLDSSYFDTSNNKLSLKLNSITPWNVNQNNVYYNVGNIGIGTDNPRTKLQVTGDVSANNFIGSGARLTNLNPNNINGIVPVTKGGTGTTSLDSSYFDTSNNKLSLKLNSITPWNVNQNNVYYNVGNIGIGTDNPRTKLQVTGDVSANNFIGSGARLTNLNPNNINGIVPVTKGGTGTTSLDSSYFDTSNNKLSLKLNSITPWNVNQDNVYYNVGNIGIGTDNPRTKLQVTGDVSANNFIGSGARLTNLNPNNINGIVPVTKGGTGTTSLDSTYFDTSNNKLSLKLNSITPWNVNQDNVYYNVGNIGIGTDNPRTKLQVTGDVSANNFIGSGARLTNLNPNNINGIVPVTKGGTGTTSLDSSYFDTSNNKLSLKLNSITPWNVNQNNVYYNVGNIGIGTDNPRTKLQVTGDVSANNFIGSGARLTNLEFNNINGIVPVMQGGTGTTSLDSTYFDTSNNKLSLKLNSITPWKLDNNDLFYDLGDIIIGNYNKDIINDDLEKSINIEQFSNDFFNLQPPPSSQFGGPPPSSQFGGPPPSSQFGGPPPSSQFGGPPPSSQFGGPPPSSQFGGPPPSSQFGGPPPSSQFGGPPPSSQFGGPPPSSQFGRPPPSSQFGGPPPSSQFGGPPPSSQFGGPPPSSQFGGPPPSSQFGGPQQIPQIGGPQPILQIGGPQPIPQIGGPQPIPQIGGPQPIPQIGELPQPIPQIGGPQPIPQIGGPQPIPQIGGLPQPIPQIGGPLSIPTNNKKTKLRVMGDIIAHGNMITYGKIHGNINASNITGIIPIDKGGTGLSSFEKGELLFGGNKSILHTNNLSWDNDTSKLQVSGDIIAKNKLCIDNKCIDSNTITNLIDIVTNLKTFPQIKLLGMRGSGDSKIDGGGLPDDTLGNGIKGDINTKFRFGIKSTLINNDVSYAVLDKNNSEAILLIEKTSQPEIRVYFKTPFMNPFGTVSVLERMDTKGNWYIVNTKNITTNVSQINYYAGETGDISDIGYIPN